MSSITSLLNSEHIEPAILPPPVFKNIRGPYRTYRAIKKKEVLATIDRSSVADVSKTLKIPRTTLYTWKKRREEGVEPLQKAKRHKGGGCKTKLPKTCFTVHDPYTFIGHVR